MVKDGLKVAATFSPVVYKVTIGATEHGTVTSNIQEGATGSSVKFEITPEEGYTLDTFKVNGVDKAAEITGNTFETTIQGADLTIAATFAAIDSDVLYTNLISKLYAAKDVELSGSATRALHRRSTIGGYGTTINETDFNRFASEAEGTYALIKKATIKPQEDGSEKITQKSRQKIIKNGTDFISVTDTLDPATGAIKEGQRKVENSKSSSSITEGLVTLPNAGQGYIANIIKQLGDEPQFGAQKLEIKLNGNTTELSYELLSGVYFKIFKGSFTFDGDKLTSLDFESTQYSSFQYTIDEITGLVTINEGVTATKMIESVTYTYGEPTAEPEEGKFEAFKDLLASSYDITIKEGNTEIKPTESSYMSTYQLKVGKAYTISFSTTEEGKILEFPSTELPSWGSEGVTLSPNTYSGTYSLSSTQEQSSLSLTFNTSFGETKYLNFEFAREPLTTLTLSANDYMGAPITSTDTGGQIPLAIEANDPSCDNSVAFVFEGDSLGSKIVYDSDYQSYVLTAGDKAGTIKFHAISTTDSTIVSNTLTIEVKKAATLAELFTGTFVSSSESFYLTQFEEEITFSEVTETGGKYSIAKPGAEATQTGIFTFVAGDYGASSVKFDKAINLTFIVEEKTFVGAIETLNYSVYQGVLNISITQEIKNPETPDEPGKYVNAEIVKKA